MGMDTAIIANPEVGENPRGDSLNVLGEVLTTTLQSVSAGSRKAYSHNLSEFLGWWKENNHQHRSAYAAVVSYLAYLQDSRGLSFATANQHLSAIRAFFKSAMMVGAVDEKTYHSVREVHNVKQSGQRLGTWLTYETSQKLLNLPAQDTLKGKRDRAILGLMIGCMLRRSEVAKLTWGNISYREDGQCWVVKDIQGKHNRIRTTPLPGWAYERLALYDGALQAGGYKWEDQEMIFYHINRHGQVKEPLTDHAIWQIVRQYAKQAGIKSLAPHDLRRTGAELFLRNGGSMRDLQLILGHASSATTERYLAKDIDFTAAAQVVQFDTNEELA